MTTNFTNKIPRKIAAYFLIIVGLVALDYSIYLQTHSQKSSASLTENFKQAPIAPSQLDVSSFLEVQDKPVKLIIPAIEVNAAIQSVGLSETGNGEMGVPTNLVDVAWYNQGPLPGMPGSAVIDGHMNGINVTKAVFYDLRKLKLGDLVTVVNQGGKTLRFQVVNIKTYNYNDATNEVFAGDATKARLNLITCAGSWVKNQETYNKRIVVFTELIETD